MDDNRTKPTMLQEHEKLVAFIALLVAIIGLAVLGSTLGSGSATSTASDVVLNAKLRIIDGSVVGLIGIAGMAAQALFRVSTTDRINAEAARDTLKLLPPPAVTVPQPQLHPDKVVITEPASVEVAAPSAAPAYDGPEIPAIDPTAKTPWEEGQ
jgi:hypothetical protein